MIELTENDLRLLREIARSGGKKYTAGPIDRSRYTRLETAGFLKGQPVNSGDIVYELLPAADEQIQNGH